MNLNLGHIRKVTIVLVELKAKENTYHFVELFQKKGEIELGKQVTNLSSVEEVNQQVSKNNPILLHFIGKGILNRKVAFQENYQATILLNGNRDAFYFTDFIQGKDVFSAVIRKDLVDEIITEFQSYKKHVISISAGPFHAVILQSVLEKESFVSGGVNLHFENGELRQFEKVLQEELHPGKELRIGTEKIKEILLPCAAVGALFFSKDEQYVFPDNLTVFGEMHKEAEQKNIFMRFGMGIMLAFLIVLTANYFYVLHLNEVIGENSLFLYENSEQSNLMADLEEEKDRKEKLLQSSGLLNRNFLSFYLMEISSSLPQDIILDDLILRPFTDEIKAKKNIVFDEHRLLINGRSKTSQTLSDWIEKIEERKWLEKVDILDYQFIDKEGVFKLEMQVF